MDSMLVSSTMRETAPSEPSTLATVSSADTESIIAGAGSGIAAPPRLRVALLTGGQDPHYAFGLSTALLNANIDLDVIGSDVTDGPEMHGTAHLRFLNLIGSRPPAGILGKVRRIFHAYFRTLLYATTSPARIFHVLWNGKLEYFDRTLMMLFLKRLGKKTILTAHNVNAGRRDERDSYLNRTTLRCQYRLADHIFVHTQRMKDELVAEFHVALDKVTVIPYGLNNAVPLTGMAQEEARQRLALRNHEKAILYFGAIKQYKGLEYLVPAFQCIAAEDDYRLIIAGEQKKDHEEYWQSIQTTINSHPTRNKVLQKIGFVPDAEIETYFMAADVLVLPYTGIFQSGVLFLAYVYGLPVIATDVGSFKKDVIEGRTGFICRPRDPDDLAVTLKQYFRSELFMDLERRRQEIREFAFSTHSWTSVGRLTRCVYDDLLRRNAT